MRNKRSEIWLSDFTYSKDLGIKQSSLVFGFMSIAIRGRLKIIGEILLSNQASLISNLTLLMILIFLTISSSIISEKQHELNEFLIGRNTSALWPWTDPNNALNANPFEPIGPEVTVIVDSKTAKINP